MLVNLNRVASELKLSHQEYRLMGILIGLWNMAYNKAFPTVQYLAESCNMSKSTVLKNLDKLIDKHLLIVVKEKGRRNNYYITKNLFQKIAGTETILESTSWETTHDKHTKKKTDKKNHYDDQKQIKPDNLTREIILKLRQWNYKGVRDLLKQFSSEELKEIIQQVESYNPANKGAYFRVLLKSNNYNTCQPKDFQLHQQDKINLMLQYQYWKHKKTGYIYKVKPSIGQHLYIRYNSENEMVYFTEYQDFSDTLDNFIPATKEDLLHLNSNQAAKPDKNAIIADLINKNCHKEATQLRQIFKIKSL